LIFFLFTDFIQILLKPICWNNSNYNDSKVVILGIPDESRSHSLREGTSKGPDQIRKISNLRDSYQRNGKITKGYPYDTITKKVHDIGNISREEIPETFKKLIRSNKIPIILGGDHSISHPIIKSISKESKDISLVYFDAHPDFVTSTKNYYGSVFGDCLNYVDKTTSLQIGVRTPEKEEHDNIKENRIKVITPFEIEQKGLSTITNEILSIIGDNTYISFDMDCIDPANAPGVSVPVPMGLSSVQAAILLKNISKKGIIGMDIVEVCPPFDVNDRTSHLASRLVAEVISSLK